MLYPCSIYVVVMPTTVFGFMSDTSCLCIIIVYFLLFVVIIGALLHRLFDKRFVRFIFDSHFRFLVATIIEMMDEENEY